MVAVRFAPSPTGRLHVGNARIALVNWLFARKNGGSFLFRLDDTDTERSTEEFARAIEDDLRWLGLYWDAFARESDRYARYDEAIAQLKAAGRLYPAWETAEELELRRKLQIARHRPPVYDRAACELTEADKARLTAERGAPHWRFRLDGRRVAWTDLVKGETAVDTASLSDPVLIRADGRPLYTLTSVVDDIDFAISHVIRGEDHVTNTGVQIELFEALGGTVPGFGHLSLLVDAAGAGLSKRLGALSLRSLREEEGVEAMAVNALLARLGTADPVEPAADLASLVAGFDLGRFGRAPARFDPAELQALSARVLQLMPFETVRGRLPPGADDRFWLAVRGNLARLDEAAAWWDVVAGKIDPVAVEDGAGVLAAAAGLLPAGPLTGDSWGAWTKAIGAATGARGKALFLPLRLALTGRGHGPEMKELLPLIGRDKVLHRLQCQGGQPAD
ncbi:glutamyl-tRNA synthetase [Zavarzinia compransoris]|uniref:Glutamate--tRNA ligase n=2 Tax=Zavarzinia compransoris TaxID=1264899 RepID=A0A317EBJ1_9PROT|nr:glutamate--tRNA ligase [Zavarzinia compransoris]PWR23634.1 glutamate--tRNA ligase [Zavarzinia compransoris]TDP47853.1 glutamyl-tRNA synthetase [Zavarzinia compransoris]